MDSIKSHFLEELPHIEAVSIGWIPLDKGAYLHIGLDEPVIQVLGVPAAGMAGSNLLWLGWVPTQYLANTMSSEIT